jgi:RNA polymerase sigma-70 factor (ECF subfamily)
VNGEIGIVMAPRGRLFRALRFTFAGGDASGWKIAALEVIGDPARLGALDLAVVD